MLVSAPDWENVPGQGLPAALVAPAAASVGLAAEGVGAASAAPPCTAGEHAAHAACAAQTRQDSMCRLCIKYRGFRVASSRLRVDGSLTNTQPN